MKCGAWIVSVTTPKGRVRFLNIAPRYYGSAPDYHRFPESNVRTHLSAHQISKKNAVSDILECDGEIVCTIEAHDEGIMDYSRPEIEVDYRCSKCGNAHFPNLPNEYSLGNFMTKLIAEMPDAN